MVEDMFRIILDVAKGNKLTRVDKVNLVIGEYLQVKPSLLRFAFDAARMGTLAAGATLTVNIVPVELKCESCGEVFYLHDLHYLCNRCGSGQLEIINGKDMYIKSIEGE
jgi:hydrogenase nickel incorporation protein HypA/HybF